MTSLEHSNSTSPHLPGEFGIWMFIIGDLVMFSLLFGVFMYYRADDVTTYVESQKQLNQLYGLINTLLLLTSSWFVALGVKSARNKLLPACERCLALAMICGAAFVAIKYFEYAEKFAANVTLETNDFFMYYFLMTGIHLLHVLIGIGVLFFMWHLARRVEFGDSEIIALESGASFWHLVDILWIVLFALLYLVR